MGRTREPSDVEGRPVSRPPSIYRPEGWAKFIDTPLVERPHVPNDDEWAGMAPAERRASRRARIDYHLRPGVLNPIPTPATLEVATRASELIDANLNGWPNSPYGLAVDGHATVGKTTALLMFCRDFEQKVRLRRPTGTSKGGHKFVPIVNVSIEGDTSIKTLNRDIVTFYGGPPAPSMNEMTKQIEDRVDACETAILVLDDIHHIDVRYREHKKLCQHIKNLGATTGVTIICGGIDCASTSILSGGGGSLQATEYRFTHFVMKPPSLRTKQGRDEWRAVLLALEGWLALRADTEGMLTALSEYLFEWD